MNPPHLTSTETLLALDIVASWQIESIKSQGIWTKWKVIDDAVDDTSMFRRPDENSSSGNTILLDAPFRKRYSDDGTLKFEERIQWPVQNACLVIYSSSENSPVPTPEASVLSESEMYERVGCEEYCRDCVSTVSVILLLLLTVVLDFL